MTRALFDVVRRSRAARGAGQLEWTSSANAFVGEDEQLGQPTARQQHESDEHRMIDNVLFSEIQIVLCRCFYIKGQL